ncbi:MAG: Sugar phosphate isomerase/epimerase [Clostridia bacterium]|nr:Sugar phosphate isomerase/epimerase [Clostridia bacterium]
MSKIPVALELYSVREELSKDLEGTLKAVKSYGYEAVEFAGYPHQYSAERIAKALKDNDLYCCSWHVPIEAFADDKIEETIKYHKAAGNKFLIVPWVPEKQLESYETIKKTGEMFNKISEKLAVHDMYTGYHNHNAEFKALPDSPLTAWSALRECTNDNFIMQMDTGNALSGDADVNKEILSAKGRCQIIHLKPYSLKTGYATLIGTDDIDYKTIMPFCKKEGKTMIYVIEYECKELYSELEGVKLCYEGLMNNYADLL